jgi:hypothetical protein
MVYFGKESMKRGIHTHIADQCHEGMDYKQCPHGPTLYNTVQHDSTFFLCYVFCQKKKEQIEWIAGNANFTRD